MKSYEFGLILFQGLTAFLVACCFGWCCNLVYDTYFNSNFVCYNPASSYLFCKLGLSLFLVCGVVLFFICLLLTGDYYTNIKK